MPHPTGVAFFIGCHPEMTLWRDLWTLTLLRSSEVVATNADVEREGTKSQTLGRLLS